LSAWVALAARLHCTWLRPVLVRYITNLQRQILYRTRDIGVSKVELAKSQLMALNPQSQVVSCHERLSGAALQQRVADVDLVLDCSDNMPTRHDVNRACYQSGKPLISGSAVGFKGQLLVLMPPYEHGCYACLYPDDALAPLNCRTAGVLGPVVGMIGSAQALEAIKILTGQPSALNGQLQLFDGKQQRWQRLSLNRSPQCPVCGDKS